jgi:hypothetical protein
MQKQYVVIGVLVVIAAGWYFVSLNEPKAAPVVTPEPATTTSTTTTEVATGTTSAPTTPDEIELDLTKLQGKDRLYTEEEGKYENLSEEERKMITDVICREKEWLCNDISQDTRLISLRDEVAIVYTHAESFNGILWIYNIKTAQQLASYRDTGTVAFGSDYIIQNSQNEQTQKWLLEFYRPGMSDFIPIPDSQINLEFSYLENVTFVQRALPIEFDDNTITAYVHHYEYDEDGPKSVFGNLPLNYTLISKTPKTFDLSNLP